jgi:hypothetical protein
MKTTMTSERRLIPGVVVGGVDLSQALQDDVHHFQDIDGGALILRDLQDGRHAKVRQNLGNVHH